MSKNWKEQKKCLETIHEKPQVEKITQQKIQINQGKWYHQYYWWYTKNGFLVVGGKNANDNETLVKNYLREKDYYFHSDEPGSGSFILFVEEKLPEVIDLHETSEGVFSLSKYWNIANSGKIFSCSWKPGFKNTTYRIITFERLIYDLWKKRVY